MEFAGKKVLILGGGVTGSAVAKIIEELGSLVHIADEKPPTDFAIHPIDDLENLNYDLTIVSPGWKPNHPLVQALQNKKVRITNEVDIAWHFRNLHQPNQKWIAITGTNGKTTTTELTAAMLNASGIAAAACGNVGTTVIETLFSDKKYDVLVLELSSFQLQDIEKKSLEAHVELCAERYKNLDDKLCNLETRMDKVEQYLVDIKESLSNKDSSQYKH